MWEKLADYLKQPSTWKGIALFAGLFGIVVSPESQTAIIAGVTVLYGLIQIFMNENKGE